MNDNYSADQSHAWNAHPPYGAGQPQPSPRGFFDTLRTSGFVRSEPRVVGGVLSGLTLKYGWDTTLLRVLMVIGSFFFPLLASLYALAWAFLPERRDGRIHAEALTLGYFDIAQVGAGVLFLLGLGNSALWTTFTLGFDPLVLSIIVVPIVVILLVVTWGSASKSKTPPPPSAGPTMAPPGAQPFTAGHAGGPAAGPHAFTGTPGPQAFSGSPTGGPSAGAANTPGSASHASHSADASAQGAAEQGATMQGTTPEANWRTQGGPTAATGGPTYSAAQPAPGQPNPAQPNPGQQGSTGFAPYSAAGASAPGGYPMAGGAPYFAQPRPSYTPVAPMRARSVPAWVNLLATGMVISVMTLVFAMLNLPHFAYTTVGDAGRILLIGGGLCLLIVAIPMVIAAMRDRSAYWLVALSIIGMFLAIPTTAAGVAMVSDWNRHLEIPHLSTIPETHHSSQTHNIGTVANATWDLSDLPEGDTSIYEADQVVGLLTIFVRQGQEIEIRVADSIGMVSANYLDGSVPWVNENIGVGSGRTMRSIDDPNKAITVLRVSGVLGRLHIVEVEAEQPVAGSSEESPSVEAPQSAVAPQSGQSGVTTPQSTPVN